MMTPALIIHTLSLSPGNLILAGLLFVIVVTYIFWPRKGLVALITRIKMNNQRVQLEDALKYLFDCEYKSNPCDIHSIAGNLNISGDQAGKLLNRLLALGLITLNDQTISLTKTGRSYSLRVIRVHRIWEKFLADETGVAETDWHNEADRLEHFVSQEDIEKMAASMGNPVYDPHGDPIPSAIGELPEPKGKALSCLKEGEQGRIIHMEDEPSSIYEQLVALGLYPGMTVFVSHVDKGKIIFVANGEECTLTPLFANHITVEVLSGKMPSGKKARLLSSLDIGEQAEIVGISPSCRGQQRRRLMDLGIVTGSLITAAIKSPSGDPTGYRVMGTTLGIRKKQADMILIRKTDQ